MNKKLVITIVIILFIGAIAIFIFTKKNNEDNNSINTDTGAIATPSEDSNNSMTSNMASTGSPLPPDPVKALLSPKTTYGFVYEPEYGSATYLSYLKDMKVLVGQNLICDPATDECAARALDFLKTYGVENTRENIKNNVDAIKLFISSY